MGNFIFGAVSTGVVVGYGLLVAIKCWNENEEKWETKEREYETTIESLRQEKNYYRNLWLEAHKKNASRIDDELVLAAVKSAMMNSHPDKGGSSKKFIAYKELWDKLRGK